MSRRMEVWPGGKAGERVWRRLKDWRTAETMTHVGDEREMRDENLR